MSDFVKNYIENSIKTKEMLLNDEKIIETISKIAQEITKAYNAGKKVLVAGNGGSAADAQHFATELVSRFYFDRPALSAIALTVDTSILTAVANDYGYDKVFSRQIEANGVKGDIFVAISTSGNSQNIVEALKCAREKGLVTVGLCGAQECKMDSLCDYIIKAPSKDVPNIQETHIMLIHVLCAIIEKKMFKN